MNEIGEKNKNSKKVLLIIGIVMSVALISILMILLLKPQNEPNYAKNDSDINEDDESYEDDEEWEEEESDEEDEEWEEYESKNIRYTHDDIVIIYDKEYILYDKKNGSRVKLNIYDENGTTFMHVFDSNGLIITKRDNNDNLQDAYYDLDNQKYLITFGKYRRIYGANDEYILIGNDGYIQLIDYSENEIVKVMEDDPSKDLYSRVPTIEKVNKDGKDATYFLVEFTLGDNKFLIYEYYYIKSTKELIKSEYIHSNNC